MARSLNVTSLGLREVDVVGEIKMGTINVEAKTSRHGTIRLALNPYEAADLARSLRDSLVQHAARAAGYVANFDRRMIP